MCDSVRVWFCVLLSVYLRVFAHVCLCVFCCCQLWECSWLGMSDLDKKTKPSVIGIRKWRPTLTRRDEWIAGCVAVSLPSTPSPSVTCRPTTLMTNLAITETKVMTKCSYISEISFEKGVMGTILLLPHWWRQWWRRCCDGICMNERCGHWWLQCSGLIVKIKIRDMHDMWEWYHVIMII